MVTFVARRGYSFNASVTVNMTCNESGEWAGAPEDPEGRLNDSTFKLISNVKNIFRKYNTYALKYHVFFNVICIEHESVLFVVEVCM